MKIKLLDDRLSVPTYATQGSAAIDLRACDFGSQAPFHEYVTSSYFDLLQGFYCLYPEETVMIGTGIALNMSTSVELFTYPFGVLNRCGLVLPRSGLGSKGIVLANSLGLIDTDYQGEIKVCLYNRSNKKFIIEPLDRIAQLIFITYFKPQFEVVNEFEEKTQRGSGGFHSTGSK